MNIIALSVKICFCFKSTSIKAILGQMYHQVQIIIYQHRKRKQLNIKNNMTNYIRMESNKCRQIMAMSVDVIPETQDHMNQFDMDELALALSNTVRFETDSVPVKIDNCCTQSMSGFESDFMHGTLKQLHNVHVYGFADTRKPITHKGTIQWTITDDQGQEHKVCIPNSYYVPDCNARLLSPQHWAQQLNDNYPKKDGTVCTTYHDRIYENNFSQ
jgi:hypothetical protein